jgi:hypothetical protein
LFFSAHGQTTGGVYYVGQFTTTGNTTTAKVDAITAQFSSYPDRATSGTGTLDGHLIQRTSIDGSVTINTDPATLIAGGQTFANSLSVTFSTRYNRPSSLDTIAGNYGQSSLTLTIASDGVLSAQDASTGCAINGTIVTIDPHFNLYAVTLSTMNCSGEFGVPDGAHLKGLATLDDSQDPESLYIGAADSVSATKSAMTIQVNRS